MTDQPCTHSFPDPYPQPMTQPGNCRNCGISYQEAKTARRIPLDEMTSDQLDDLYEQLARAQRIAMHALDRTVPHQTTPSRRAGLRDEIAAALEAADYRGSMRRGDLADSVMPVLHREWPWLRAEAEDAAPDEAGPEPSDPTQCSGEEGFCPEHGFHRHSLKQPGDLRDQIAGALYERERPPRDPHWPDAFAMDREVFEAMADTVLAVIPPVAGLARRAEVDVSRVIGLYEQWVKAGPPPLGTSLARWWDRRLVELRAAINREGQPAGHVYLSTGCFHGDQPFAHGLTGHQYCQNKNGILGAKKPARCKSDTCNAPCICPCHHKEPQP